MRRALAYALVACFGCVTLTALGCSSAPGAIMPPPSSVGGNGDVARGGATDWPSGHGDAPPTHHAFPIVLAHGFSGFHNIGSLNASARTRDGRVAIRCRASSTTPCRGSGRDRPWPAGRSPRR